MKRRTLWINLGIGALIVVIIALIVASLQSREEPTNERTVTVSRGDISATVTASGSVERSGVVELVFSSPGTVTSVDVQAGDRVVVGQVLATVDDTAALQQLAAAESTLAQSVQSAASTDASVASASAALTDARRLARQTNKRNELAVAQARESLSVAQSLWNDSCLSINDPACPNPSAQAQLRAAQATIDSAQLSLDVANRALIDNAAGYDVAVGQASEILGLRQRQQTDACAGQLASSAGCTTAEAATVTARQAFDNAVRTRDTGRLADQNAVQTASLNLASANVALQRTQADLRKAGNDAVRSARQALETAQRTLTQGEVGGEQSVRSAQSALQSALAAEQTVAIPGGDEVTAAQATIAAAESGVAAAQATLDDTRLIAPVSGTVGQVPYVVGELTTSTATTGGITVIPDGPLEVVADFAESDAAGIAVGAEATVTFDALAGEQAKGSVIAVDPVATTSASGLITYSVRVQVANPPDAVREGMTASVSVLINEVTDVLIVPQGAITGSGDRATVLLQKPDGTTEASRITIGLQGDGGTEVTGGLQEGDILVIPSADDLAFPQGGVPGSGRDDDPDGPFGGGGD